MRIGIAAGAVLALVLACALTAIATAGHRLLPAIMRGNQYTPAMIFVVGTTWGFSLLALVALWRKRPHSVLDVWLMVVMCAWLFDIALAAVLNHGRFDLGFYAGRAYGLLAASFVLWVLLLENGMLYARLVTAHRRERQKSAELKALNEELEAFSYSISHDLRAPLRAVDGYTRMFEDRYAGQLDEEGRRLIGVVRARSQLMGRLIDELLEFSRLGRGAVNARTTSINELVRDIIEELRPEYESRDIEFHVGDLGEANFDPVLLKQALANLIGNAVKFTRHTPDARIEIGAKYDPTQERKVYFVKDNGTGFDMRYADKLFGVFQRLHSAKEYEGTGVGLAIVHRIIQRHNGNIWAESIVNHGATFYFTLDSAPANAAAA